jgi:hypothetical protein
VRLLRTRRPLLAAIAIVLLVVTTVVVATPSRAGAATRYVAPVPDPVVEHFDLPEQRWQAGNRGVDYAPVPGTPVVASADGEVVFAGQVGGQLHVTVRHPDGLRTSYSFLAEVDVRRGARVRAGQQLGTAGSAVHFGVRAPDDTYLDPEALLAGLLDGRPVLVPSTAEGADPLEERRHLLGVVADAIGAVTGATVDIGVTAAAVTVAAARATTDLLLDLAELSGQELVAAVRDLLGVDCTDGADAAPVIAERRIVVLVSGLGTDSGANSAWMLPTDDLGYADADVVRFSYDGGRAPADGVAYRDRADGLAGIEQRAFDGLDTQQPLAASADALADLLGEVADREPGVPIDVVAHSQGGVVSRLAIDTAGRQGRLPAEVENLVTLGSPHAGTHMADGVVAAQGSATGRAILDEAVERRVHAPLDPRLPAISELASDAAIAQEVHDRPLPDGVRFTSIGARGDWIVPAGRTRDDAARQVVVDSLHGTDEDVGILGGVAAHGELPEAPDAVREVALAVNEMPPTCQALLDRLIDVGASGAIGGVERGLADVLDVTAPVIDRFEPSDDEVRRDVDQLAEVAEAEASGR